MGLMGTATSNVEQGTGSIVKGEGEGIFTYHSVSLSS